jgi:hypothetical protein
MTQVNEPMANPKGNLETLKPYQAKWNSGTTRTIRVPVVLADQVLEYAHKLDNGESLTQVNEVTAIQGSKATDETLTQVIQLLEESLKFPSNNASKTKAKVREALALLQ